MQYLASLALLLQLCLAASSIGYNPKDYLEVYPDPTDPEVLRGRKPLHFALIQSLQGQVNGSGIVAGVKVALDRINNDSSLLPGYTLHYTFTDSMVSYYACIVTCSNNERHALELSELGKKYCWPFGHFLCKWPNIFFKVVGRLGQPKIK